MTNAKSVEEYLEKHPNWAPQIEQIRSIIAKTELNETIKWGAPAYVLDKKILLGIGAFKNHLGLWFHQGVFLKDLQKKLVAAQEKTKALRQWRIEPNEDIDEVVMAAYIQESIENCLAGKEVKPVRKKGVTIPPELAAVFKKNSSFHKAFLSLTEGKQREYADHIASAKRAETKTSRIEKIVPMVTEGKGLHDKYKNC